MNLDKLAKLLSESSGYKRQGLISRDCFEKYVFGHSKTATRYLWTFYAKQDDKAETISEDAFIRCSDKILGIITDKDQINFYLKMFANGKDMVGRSSFLDFLRSAFVLYQTGLRRGSGGDDDSDASSATAVSWMESVYKSAYHVKTEMSVCFLTNWVLENVPRLLIPMHKYITNQLVTGYQKMKASNKTNMSSTIESGFDDTVKVQQEPCASLIHPILMWLLRSSLPGKYLSLLEKKSEAPVLPHCPVTSPHQLLQLLGGQPLIPETWTLLYDSDDQGLSINRFQHHIFNYRGPTLIFVKADNDYLFCIASDTEWRESCHFWGGEESLLLMVKPEFKIVEKGAKLLYANFAIRGYPFGIQVGKDPRHVSIEIKPEFNYVSYKQMPCKIIRLLAWGCAPPQVKASQTDLRKWEAKQAENHRKINLNNPEWKDNPDKYLLELAGNYRSYDTQ